MFGGGSSTPQVYQSPLPAAKDTPPTVDPTGVKDWLIGAVGKDTLTQKDEKTGFALGQSIGLQNQGRKKGSIFTQSQGLRT